MLSFVTSQGCKSIDRAHIFRMKRFCASYKMYFGQRFNTAMKLQKRSIQFLKRRVPHMLNDLFILSKRLTLRLHLIGFVMPNPYSCFLCCVFNIVCLMSCSVSRLYYCLFFIHQCYFNWLGGAYVSVCIKTVYSKMCVIVGDIVEIIVQIVIQAWNLV